ncbi:hypothetical protein CHCC5022_1041 [Bacillus paralicheniformis]|nr:hypothetical protein CHCC5022_1041 [Bacillus paralicheniformis]TWJ80998.1 hypothetical protein CHCC4186_3949 [Bacillus paralicheniformis]TWK82800.1 hypothetical protein CHCC20333_1758 [Bacillus paralicheniformis]
MTQAYFKVSPPFVRYFHLMIILHIYVKFYNKNKKTFRMEGFVSMSSDRALGF